MSKSPVKSNVSLADQKAALLKQIEALEAQQLAEHEAEVQRMADFARDLERRLAVALRERDEARKDVEDLVALNKGDEDLFEDPFTGEPCSYDKWVDREVKRIREKDE